MKKAHFEKKGLMHIVGFMFELTIAIDAAVGARYRRTFAPFSSQIGAEQITFLSFWQLNSLIVTLSAHFSVVHYREQTRITAA